MKSFAQNFQALVRKKKTLLFLGLDPRLDLIAEDFKAEIQLPDNFLAEISAFSLDRWISAEKVNEFLEGISAFHSSSKAELRNFLYFSVALILALKDEVIGVKFQSACFERVGVFGKYALCVLATLARHLGLLTIFDGKRGDIGVTLKQYFQAYLSDSNAPVSMSFDAMTVNPNLGVDTWEEALPFLKAGKQLFFVTYPSSPTASDFSEALACGVPLYSFIAESVKRFLATHRLDFSPAPIGFVVGANKPEICAHIRNILPSSIMLAPGVGAQGAQISEVAPKTAGEQLLAIFPISRSIIHAYKDTKMAPDEVSVKFYTASLARAQRFNEELRRAVSFG